MVKPGYYREVDWTCSDVSAQDEPLEGTAGSSRRWLCIEHPGPWGTDIVSSQVWGEWTEPLAQWADHAGARLLSVRRPGSGRSVHTHTKIVIATTEKHSSLSYAREITLTHLEELHARDPEEVYDPQGSLWNQGREWSKVQPVLVCAHGRRDRCCAVKGRPVAESLLRAGFDVWESSHTGGHRFAPAVLFLPEGNVYGRLGPEQIVKVAKELSQGRVVLDGLRGRTCWTAREQVAEIAIRRKLSDAEVHIDVQEEENHTVTGTVSHSQGVLQRFVVTVESEKLPPRPASCGAAPKSVMAWRCRDIREVSGNDLDPRSE